MRFAFDKMHGLGNDFVVIDARVAPLTVTPALARAIADRHTGIGCDQLILLEPASDADLAMRIWNADGGEVEACGNASRAVARLLGKPATVSTAGGMVRLEPGDDGATVELPAPRFAWNELPLAYPADTAALPVAWEELSSPAAVNVGNPHVVFFVPDADAVDLARLGPLIEHDALFPQRINVNVASVSGPQALRLRVWERGAGLTRACGTGACATAIAALRRRLVTGPVSVALPGGTVVVTWAPGGRIALSGPASHVFHGEAEIAA